MMTSVVGTLRLLELAGSGSASQLLAREPPRDMSRERKPMPVEISSFNQQMSYRTWIARGVEELGPWFHNLDLARVKMAPDHFLGDHPTSKWKNFKRLWNARD